VNVDFLTILPPQVTSSAVSRTSSSDTPFAVLVLVLQNLPDISATLSREKSPGPCDFMQLQLSLEQLCHGIKFQDRWLHLVAFHTLSAQETIPFSEKRHSTTERWYILISKRGF